MACTAALYLHDVADQRRALRHPADAPGTLHADAAGAVAIRLRDISGHGFRCEGDCDRPIGARVALDLGTGSPCTAIVRWRHAREMGCEFVPALTHEAVVAAFPAGEVTRSDFGDFRHWIFETPAAAADVPAAAASPRRRIAAAAVLGFMLLLLTGSRHARARRREARGSRRA